MLELLPARGVKISGAWGNALEDKEGRDASPRFCITSGVLTVRRAQGGLCKLYGYGLREETPYPQNLAD